MQRTVCSSNQVSGVQLTPPFFEGNIMTTFLIGAAIGAGLTVAFVLKACKMHTKEKWKEFEVEMATQRKQLYMVIAENARLRIARCRRDDGRRQEGGRNDDGRPQRRHRY